MWLARKRGRDEQGDMAKSEDEGAAPAEGEAAAPKSKKKLIIIAAAAVLLLGGGGGGAYFFMFKKPKEEKPAVVHVKPPAFVDLPDVLVNLAAPPGPEKRSSYLKAKIVLEVADQKIAEDIKPVMPRVMDAFQSYLREMRPTDLEGSAGLYRLRDELTRRVNLAVAPNKVNAVLFKEVVIQ
jgi:flagellar FliL protein